MNLRTNRLIKTTAVMLFGMMIISCTVFGSSPDTKNTPVIEAKLELLDGTIPSDNTDDTSTDIAIINKTGHEIEYIELRLVDEKSDTDYEKSDTDGEKLDSDYEYLDLNEKNNLLKKNDTFKFMETRKLNIRISYVDKTNSNKTDSDKKSKRINMKKRNKKRGEKK